MQKIQDHPLCPEQCAQLVEAIRLADIPAELEKQIKIIPANLSLVNVTTYAVSPYSNYDGLCQSLPCLDGFAGGV